MERHHRRNTGSAFTVFLASLIMVSALPSIAASAPIFQMRLAEPGTPGVQPAANYAKMKLLKLNRPPVRRH